MPTHGGRSKERSTACPNGRSQTDPLPARLLGRPPLEYVASSLAPSRPGRRDRCLELDGKQTPQRSRRRCHGTFWVPANRHQVARPLRGDHLGRGQPRSLARIDAAQSGLQRGTRRSGRAQEPPGARLRAGRWHGAEAYAQMLSSEIAKWRTVIKDAKIPPPT